LRCHQYLNLSKEDINELNISCVVADLVIKAHRYTFLSISGQILVSDIRTEN